SGGPFYSKSKEELRSVTLADALAHPTWSMGKKITVDSATLMNKGFEVIEAARLFNVEPDRIKVVVHPESIIHSMVEYIDSAIIAQLSVPDMRLCVAYALNYPERVMGATHPLDLIKLGALTFKAPDTETFPLLALAFRALEDGKTRPAVLNAANEIAVNAFLNEKIRFTDIADVVFAAYEKTPEISGALTIENVYEYDALAREFAAAECEKIITKRI
ncbi:MAG: 1-deoxy-D-xylulose-5-phosphate reductoisomerase, partial [Clostridia bacterium]|nr:1-deoxy-D-xylulose-5-phosphate reductoisomerase [Clostridia bacterium]